jgi:hypothetical protein
MAGTFGSWKSNVAPAPAGCHDAIGDESCSTSILNIIHLGVSTKTQGIQDDLETGWAPLEECGDALPKFFGRSRLLESSFLAIELSIEVRRACLFDQRLDAPVGFGRAAGNALRHVERLGSQSVCRDDFIDEPQRERSLCRHCIIEPHHLERTAATEEMGQRPCRAGVRSR